MAYLDRFGMLYSEVRAALGFLARAANAQVTGAKPFQVQFRALPNGDLLYALPRTKPLVLAVPVTIRSAGK